MDSNFLDARGKVVVDSFILVDVVDILGDRAYKLAKCVGVCGCHGCGFVGGARRTQPKVTPPTATCTPVGTVTFRVNMIRSGEIVRCGAVYIILCAL